MGQSVLRCARKRVPNEEYLYTLYLYSIKSKGKQVNILVLSVGDCLISCQAYVVTQTSSNTSQVVLERVFFFVTSSDDPGISSTGDRVQMKVKSSRSCYFLGASFVILENLSEIINFALICTLNRIRSPRWKASSQLEQGSTRKSAKSIGNFGITIGSKC